MFNAHEMCAWVEEFILFIQQNSDVESLSCNTITPTVVSSSQSLPKQPARDGNGDFLRQPPGRKDI